jgi:acetyltransferase-like isoleucine patch superfamily enzyme
MDDMEPSLTVIGDSVTISYCVKFAVHGKGQGHMPIRVGDGAYIGMGAMIVSGKNGCVIGDNAIVGAGSVVVNSIPEDSTAVGNPARVLRDE